MPRFFWAALQTGLEKLLRHTTSCRTWPEAIAVLAPCLPYADAAPDDR